jgi:hypothetical protein
MEKMKRSTLFSELHARVAKPGSRRQPGTYSRSSDCRSDSCSPIGGMKADQFGRFGQSSNLIPGAILDVRHSWKTLR